MSHIAWMQEGKLERAHVGGKGASLSDLIAGGFPVPEGFCVTADGYRYFVSSSGIESQIEKLLADADLSSPATAREAAERVSELVASAPLPDDLRQEISQAYEKLVEKTGFAVAVRSSAISEDGASSSFAGLYETYLNVRGVDHVLESVGRCYASLWSERAVRYRANRTSNDMDEAMAVVIMGLVPSDTSGIAFTAHPVTGDRNQVVINSSWGLGEAIVSGRVTPDCFVVNKDTLAIVEREIYPKEIAVFSDPAGGGTIEQDLSPAQARAPSLTDEEACAVAGMAAKVEVHYGLPQDIEWGMHAGTLYLLQARPITTLG
ncbi:MAG TPA: PEP/pyruvate-binding domain-containing protein [Dehalococcoidia bacterium]|nr:PEP/pyruvate-binding domain-containing protein [Dehalococcoidia bacterium]